MSAPISRQRPETGPPLEWRLGGLADATAAAELAEAAFTPEYREAWTAGQMAGLLGGRDSWLQFGLQQQQPIAFALCRIAADEVEFLLCATHPGARRQGIGRALLDRVRTESLRRGGRRLFLEVRSSNAEALSLYQAAGFTQEGRRPGYYRTLSGDRIDAITLALLLGD